MHLFRRFCFYSSVSAAASFYYLLVIGLKQYMSAPCLSPMFGCQYKQVLHVPVNPPQMGNRTEKSNITRLPCQSNLFFCTSIVQKC